jgi:hypothetical protein
MCGGVIPSHGGYHPRASAVPESPVVNNLTGVRARSSGVERRSHIPEVGGSKPPAPTILTATEIVAASISAAPLLKCGIYFLVMDGELKYVGQSVNVEARVASHRQNRQFDRWHWIECPCDQLNALERAYIDAYLPPWNMDGRTAFLRLYPPKPPTEEELRMARMRRAVAVLEA